MTGGTGDIGSKSSSSVHLLLILVPIFVTFKFPRICFAIRQFFLLIFEIVQGFFSRFPGLNPLFPRFFGDQTSPTQKIDIGQLRLTVSDLKKKNGGRRPMSKKTGKTGEKAVTIR